MTTKTLTPPKPVVRDEFYEAALAWAQEFTEGLEELPRGYRGAYAACPLAVATGLGVGLKEADWLTTCGGEEPVALPPLVSEFVWRFDDGHYPDLIER